jgi:hypothetical protein
VRHSVLRMAVTRKLKIKKGTIGDDGKDSSE